MPQEEIDGFVARLFDEDPPTAWPDTLLLSYNSDNPLPSVRVTVLLSILHPVINIFLLVCYPGSLPQSGD
jgi:hypothetical protein